MYIAPAMISCSDIINPDQLESVTRQGFITSVIYIFDSFTRLNGFVLNTLCFEETDSSGYLVKTMLWYFLRSNIRGKKKNETYNIPAVNRDISQKEKKVQPSQGLIQESEKARKNILLYLHTYISLFDFLPRHMPCNIL